MEGARTRPFATMLLALAVSGAAVGDVGAFTFDLASEEVRVRGHLEATLGGGALIFVLAPGAAPVVLDRFDGTVTIWSWNATRAEVAHPGGNLSVASRVDDAWERAYEVRGGALRLEAADAPASVRLVPGAPGAVRVHGLVDDAGRPEFLAAPVRSGYGEDLSPLRAPEEVRWSWEPGWLFLGDHGNPTWPPAWPRWADARAEVDGPVRAQLLRGVLTFRDADGVERTERLGARPLEDAGAAGASVRRESVSWAVLEGELQGGAPLSAGWGASAGDASLRLVGEWAWPAARGVVVVDGARREVHGEDVAAEGRLALVPQPAGFDDPSTRYRGSGDLSALAIGPAPVRVVEPSPGAAAVAGGLLALGAAAAVAWTLYARIDRGALDHPMRRAIVELVHASPGLYKRELQRRLGCGWGTFQFHFRALEHAGHVRTRNDGRYVLVFAGDAVADGAVIPHALARRVYEEIPADLPVPFADLRARLGISHQLLRYHVRALEARGLVHAARAPGRTPTVVRTRPDAP